MKLIKTLSVFILLKLWELVVLPCKKVGILIIKGVWFLRYVIVGLLLLVNLFNIVIGIGMKSWKKTNPPPTMEKIITNFNVTEYNASWEQRRPVFHADSTKDWEEWTSEGWGSFDPDKSTLKYIKEVLPSDSEIRNFKRWKTFYPVIYSTKHLAYSEGGIVRPNITELNHILIGNYHADVFSYENRKEEETIRLAFKYLYWLIISFFWILILGINASIKDGFSTIWKMIRTWWVEIVYTFIVAPLVYWLLVFPSMTDMSHLFSVGVTVCVLGFWLIRTAVKDRIDPLSLYLSSFTLHKKLMRFLSRNWSHAEAVVSGKKKFFDKQSKITKRKSK